MNKINNQIRREEFEKRRIYKGSKSFCQEGYDCPVFMNCLLEINQLKKQLEEKDKVIDEAIDYIKNTKNYIFDAKRNKITGELIVNNKIETNTINKIKLLEILERGKNGKS